MNESIKFEQCRINQLHEERMYIQKKTFTKWMNSFLQKAKMEVDDIFVDLADGRKLLKLLEIISGEKLGKPNNGKMRVHKIENVNKCLAFLHTKVKLESIGAEDIVDGNKTLILGLLWTIILRFQIQDIEIQLEDESDKKHSSKEALLLWCQRKTNGYPHVNVNDFSQSWRSGMAFNALIHSHRPELIDYNSLNPTNHIENLNNAFKVAQENLAIQPLLDPEDIDTPKPDERSVLTYVSSYYHSFAKYNSEVISGKRIANIIAQLMEMDRCQLNYELFTTNLLNWIKMKIFELDNRDFPNSLDGIHNEFIKFKEYRTVEKPPKYKERSEIEALLFKVQTQRKTLGQGIYVPPEGKLVQDIQKNWVDLEKAEHKRELALREEMLRLEKLNNLAESFYRKSNIRKSYLNEMIQVLSDSRYGINLSQVEATVKKHEAICADILSRGERIEVLSQMVTELEEGNYNNLDDIKQIETNIKAMWDQLLVLLKHHQSNLQYASNFMHSKREVETVNSELKELIIRMNLDPNATHLRAVEEYLQKHSLIEAQITSHGETVKRLTNAASKQLTCDNTNNSALIQKEIPHLQQSIDELNETYKQLVQIALNKREKLLKLQDFYRLLQDMDEEDATLTEKLNICQAILPGKDLLSVISLQQKHNVLEAEVKAYEARLSKLAAKCQLFVANDHPEKQLILDKLENLMEKWRQLQEVASNKSKELSDVLEAFQYHADANETESWLKEKTQLAKSEDCGSDEQAALALLQRHASLESEVIAYEHDIARLNNQSQNMIDSGVDNLLLLASDPFSSSSNLLDIPMDEIIEEDGDYIAEVPVVVEEVAIPQVKVLYNFKGKDYTVQKNEILLLLAKATAEWWHVKRENENGSGYVPANYVEEIEPKIARISKQTDKSPSKRGKSKYKRPSKRRLSIVSSGTETVKERKDQINNDYQELVNLCKNRRELLENALKMFRLNRECDAFEAWMDETESSMVKSSTMYNEQKQQNRGKQSDQPNPVNELSHQFGKFITDLLANRTRLDEIDRMAKAITSRRYLSAVKKKQENVHKKWDNLNFLQKQVGKNIEGLTTVQVFNAACDETVERMNEKLNKINNNQDVGQDLKTVRALQRRHENVERELLPIEDSLKKISILSESVMSSYPLQKQHVTKRLAELNALWEQLKSSSVNKKNLLDKMVGLQILKNSANDIIVWLKNYVMPQLQYDPQNPSFRNLINLESITKEHNDLLVDIKGKTNDIADIEDLGRKLTGQVPKEELEVIDQLVNEYDRVFLMWQDKSEFLKQCRDLIVFCQEADRLDAMMNADLAFLDLNNFGSSLNDVISLIRQHETFVNTLNSQDQRVHNFADFAEKLIRNDHFDSNMIKERRKQIHKRRKTLKEKAYDRNKMLMDAKVYHEVKSDAEEFVQWCQAKSKQIDDNELKNMANMECKLKRHQAFAAEVRANKSRQEKIVKNLQEQQNNARVDANELAEIEIRVTEEWTKLNNQIDHKDKLLVQAFEQIEYIKSLDSIGERVNDLAKVANSTDFGIDRRSCKNLMQQSKIAEHELNGLESKLQDLESKGQLIAENHYNPEAITSNCAKLSETVMALKSPLIARKQKLHESYQFYEFVFDVNAELQWIHEHLALAASTDMPQNLTDAQNWIKKFEQNLKREVDGHEVHVRKIVQKGDQLIEQGHFAKEEIGVKLDEVKDKWQTLLEMVSKRHQTLKICLTIQQFFSECLEIESWLMEKLNLVNTAKFGKDEITVVKLLQKQKAIDLEIDTYASLVGELSRQAENLVDQAENEADKKLFKSRADDLNVQLKKLQKLSNERSLKLIELKKFHEFYRESNEFLNWILAQKQLLANEDYGKDYEHCGLLQTRFFDFKRSILANEERYNQCLESAKSFDKNDDDTHFSTNIDVIKEAWGDLLSLISTKEQKFIAAIKIHRFNRDVADAYDRIKEKAAILNDANMGKDSHSALSLLRKHEIFENDLVALEAQLQILINDSAKLKAAYPGGNARNISEKLNNVVQHWEQLQASSTDRKQRLIHSYEFYRFASMVRNLEQWATNLIIEMEARENVSDVQSSQILKTEHEQLRSEIDNHEEEFNQVVLLANHMSSNPYYAEVKGLTQNLLTIREKLFNAWQEKNVYLDQLNDFNVFVHDVKQLEQLCQVHVSRLNSLEFGDSVEEVDSNLRKFEQFERLFESQEPKFKSLSECGNKLIQKNHINSEIIGSQLADLLNKRSHLRKLILERKDELSDTHIFVQFKRDVLETENWIDEKRAQIEKERLSINDDDSIETKVKKLQKHQTFEAEINANLSRITDIQNKAKHLIVKNHRCSIQIRSQQDSLLKKWNDLISLSREITDGFEEAKDICEFNRNVTQVEDWIRDKELMLQFNDTGEDYEHCTSLMRKLDDVDTGMKVDENRMMTINELAHKLTNHGRREFLNEDQINLQQMTLNDKWKQLQQRIADYRNQLNIALEVHALNRDLDDISQRIAEKQLLITKECDPKSLTSAESMQRKHEATVRDICAIEDQFRQVNDKESRQVIAKYPDLTEKSRAKIQAIQDKLRVLMQECKAKDAKLSSLVTMHRFFDLVKEAETWANDMINNKLHHVSTAVNVVQAKNDVQHHEFVKAEIVARRENYQNLKEYGIQLLGQIEQEDGGVDQAEYAKQIEQAIDKIDSLRKKLDQAWEDKNTYLKQCLELQIFLDLSKHCDSWLASKEAFLANEDLGTNLSSVEELLKKHDSFVKSLAAQQRVTDFIKFAEQLIEKEHFDLQNIQIKLNETVDRREKLMEMTKNRKSLLDDSKVYFNFLRNINEIQRWLNEKLKVANDESYRDSINLISKMQRHGAFEAEIQANKERVEAVILEGENLINQSHFKSDDIKIHVNHIEKLARALNESSALKRTRLNEANQAVQFFRLCDDLELWIKDVETIVRDQDFGKDLTSVRNQFKKHQLLESEVLHRNENIEQVKDCLANFIQNNHFMKDEIEERGDKTVQSFNEIHEPMSRRRELLEECVSFYQFKRDIEDELLWLEEKKNQVAQFDHGKSLQDIQRLIKKHKLFESELQTHEPHLSALVSKGHHLIKSNQNHSEEIKHLTYDIQNKIQQLKDESSLKRLRLADSLESQQFFADVDEAESWINEKMPFLSSDDNGKDEESVSSLTKKLETISKDAERFSTSTLTKLTQQTNQFIEKNHVESELIQKRSEALQEKFNKLNELTEKKKQVLVKRTKYFVFEHDADEFILWIKDQLIVANSEDYGTDVEHVEKLIQQFEIFSSNIESNQERITNFEKEAKLVEGSEEKLSQVMNLWRELRERTQERQETLEGARKVHRYHRSADETIYWIREKESSIVFDEVNLSYDDLSSIQTKIRELEGFDRDLNAVREQVEALYAEADELAHQFPNIRESIDDRKQSVEQIWNRLVKKTAEHKSYLAQAEKNQSYLDAYQELFSWISEMQALITADDKLGQDVVSAEEQLNRHKEYKLVIDTRNESIAAFISNGEKIAEQGHIMASEIIGRNNRIKTLHATLLETWDRRLTLYQYNLDARQFIQDAEQVEKWIMANLPLIDDHNYGDSLAEVEDLLLKHDEFEKTIEAQASKLKALERVTLIEEFFESLKQKEEAIRKDEANQRQKEQMQQMLQEEQRRILYQRKDEESQHYENASFANRGQMEKRKESKLPKRISSFAFSRKSHKVQPTSAVNLPPISFEGFLERKQILQQGGKKATSRSWKTYYTLLSGQLLCFFKDKNAFYTNVAASPPFSILNAHCVKAQDYTKKKYVFSVQLTDLSKYLFATDGESVLQEWINAIAFRSLLPPSMQLIPGANSFPVSPLPEARTEQGSGSSSSSRKSSLSSPSPLHQSHSSRDKLSDVTEDSSTHHYDNLSHNQPPTESTYANDEMINQAQSTLCISPQEDGSSTYQNVGLSKYNSLPANMLPPMKEDQISLRNQSSTSSIKSSEHDRISLNEKKKAKRKSFFNKFTKS